MKTIKSLTPLPCPCCGSKPRVGPLGACVDGVECLRCGLTLGAAWADSPCKKDKWLCKIKPYELWEKTLRIYYANKAITKWNRRK